MRQAAVGASLHLLVRAVAGKAAIHTFRAEPAVKLDRRALSNERGQVVPLPGLVRNTLAPGAKIDDRLRGSEPFL